MRIPIVIEGSKEHLDIEAHWKNVQNVIDEARYEQFRRSALPTIELTKEEEDTSRSRWYQFEDATK